MSYNLDAKVTIDVAEFKWEGQLKALLWIDIDEIEKAFVSQTAWAAFFAVVWGKANSMLKAKDYDADKKYSELYLRFSQEMSKAGERVTEATLKAKVLTDPEYSAVQADLFRLTEQVSVLSGIVRGFEHRKDMIVQSSAMKRKELLVGDYDENYKGSIDLKKVREHNQ